jgi:outer membrane PBP1 activator LpoA protein
MRLPYAVSGVVASSLPRRLSIACAAAFLILGGCSTYEAGTPKAAVNYQGNPEAKEEHHVRSLEQVINDQRDWYQMFE